MVIIMINIKELNFNYAESTGVYRFDLDINDGEIIGLFGQNGAGKTTLLKLLAGIIKPLSGEILFDEKELDYNLYNDIAYISEELSLFSEWSVDEHKIFYKTAFNKFDEERFRKLILFFELDMGKKVKNFSKGQKAKLELAIGFSKGAKYIFLDEPFLGSDPLVRADFLKIMAGLIKGDDIIFIATHLLSEIEQFIDRSIFIKYGRKIGDYSSDEILEKGGLINVSKEVFNYDRKKIDELFN